jgi:hypothetical protein
MRAISSNIALAICSAVIFSAVACGGSGMVESDRKRLAAPTPEQQACSRDSECTLVEDCCGCGNGGTQQAVRSDSVEALEAAGASHCAERSCTPGVASAHRSCTASDSVCRGGRCIPSI